MESKKEKLELLQTAIKQLIHQGKTTATGASAADSQEEDRHLLSELLSQVEALRGEDASTGVEEKEEDCPRPEGGGAGKEKAPIKEESGCSSQQEIIKQLRNVRRQNFITHCLLSALIVLTVTWQFSEVSMILKLKDGLNHPFRSIGGVLSGMFKGPVNGKEEGKEKSSRNRDNTVIEASVPGLKIPELPHVEIPSLNLDQSDP